jgi:hypothetical protein
MLRISAALDSRIAANSKELIPGRDFGLSPLEAILGTARQSVDRGGTSRTGRYPPRKVPAFRLAGVAYFPEYFSLF